MSNCEINPGWPRGKWIQKARMYEQTKKTSSAWRSKMKVRAGLVEWESLKCKKLAE